MDLGRKAADARRADLARFAVSDDAYQAWLKKVGKTEVDKPVLADVRIVGLQRVNVDYVRAELQQVAPGKAVSADDIAAAIERIYALGDFERVDYDITGPPEARVLEITPVEKGWGPNFLRFDFGLAANEGGDRSRSYAWITTAPGSTRSAAIGTTRCNSAGKPSRGPTSTSRST